MTDALFNAQEAQIAAMVADHLGVEPVKVTREARFIDDLGADSLDALELVLVIEDGFGITINDHEADKLWSVQDLFYAVARERQ